MVITNSSVEKVNYFLEELAQHVNFEMVSYLMINEWYALGDLDFNSNRYLLKSDIDVVSGDGPIQH